MTIAFANTNRQQSLSWLSPYIYKVIYCFLHLPILTDSSLYHSSVHIYKVIYCFLSLLVPPSILTHPSNISDIEEWRTIELTCSVIGTLPISISWFKVGGAIPSEATQSTNNINSTVS